MAAIPRKLWEHPDPKSTQIYEFMTRLNQKYGLNMKVQYLPPIQCSHPSTNLPTCTQRLLISQDTRKAHPPLAGAFFYIGLPGPVRLLGRPDPARRVLGRAVRLPAAHPRGHVRARRRRVGAHRQHPALVRGRAAQLGREPPVVTVRRGGRRRRWRWRWRGDRPPRHRRQGGRRRGRDVGARGRRRHGPRGRREWRERGGRADG
ncbi:hypothetical protein GGR56DRAFT_115749 [Xylariaceae sp. FL0804]|nr:hypothetical protein GGR56DRAFT_115749 [Xylariaceae sp. FL0804]